MRPEGSHINMIIKLLYLILAFLLGSLLTLFVMIKYQNWLPQKIEKKAVAPTVDWIKIQKEILPEAGFTFDVPFDDLGPKLIKTGAIDLNKFEQNFAQVGGLTSDQKEILTQKTDRRISIDQKNANFMVDFFWALGLINKNKILDESLMAADKKELGNFASTGGWTLGTKPATALFSKYRIVELTEEQQKVVETVAANVYRPCCNNPVNFPDCNHGMAALGLAEYLASKNFTEEQIYKIILRFNSFWFPQNYMDVAAFFTLTGNSWATMSSKEILGSRFSSSQGYARTKQELDLKMGIQPQRNNGAAGCGV